MREGDKMVPVGGGGGVVQVVVGEVPMYTLLRDMGEHVDIGYSRVLDRENTQMAVVVVRRSAGLGPVEKASGVAAQVVVVLVVGHHTAVHTVAGSGAPPDSEPAAS